MVSGVGPPSAGRGQDDWLWLELGRILWAIAQASCDEILARSRDPVDDGKADDASARTRRARRTKAG